MVLHLAPGVNLRAFRVRVWVPDGVWGLESWSPEVRSLESGVLGSGFWSLESWSGVLESWSLESGVPNFKKHETMALGLRDQVGYVGIDCISELERPFHHMVSFLSENVGKSLLGVSLESHGSLLSPWDPPEL